MVNVDWNTLSEDEQAYVIKKSIKDNIFIIADGTDVNVSAGTQKKLENVPNLTNFYNYLLQSDAINKNLLGNIISLTNSKLMELFKTDKYKTTSYRSINRYSEDYKKLGYDKEIIKNERINSAILDPVTYLKNKADDEKRIIDKAYNSYNEAYEQYRKFGYDENTAFEKAKLAANAYKQQLDKIHEKEFPAEITKDAKSRIVKNA